MTDLPTVLRLMGPLMPITGPECHSCGRDNSEYGNLCTADDCPGVRGEACQRCHPADPDGFYPELCPKCIEVEYGEDLAPEVTD